MTRGAGRRAWLAVGLASAASFLVLLDDSAVALSLSRMGQELGLALVGIEWVVNIYSLAFAVLVLWGGMLADRLGARRVLCAGLAAFAGVSLAAGLASSGDLLIALRAAQGMSAAFIAPAALAVVTTSFPPGRRGAALGVWAGVSASAVAAGPLIGAVLTQVFGWRSIFLVNVPLAVLLLLVAVLVLPVDAMTVPRGRLDIAGLLSSATALSFLVLGLTQATSLGWASLVVWAVFGTAAVASVAFIAVERHAENPLLDLALFRLPNFAAGNLLGLLNLAIMCSLFFFLALYLQRGMLLRPLSAGLALLPFTALIAIVAPLAGRLADRTGPRTPIVTGLWLVSVGLLLLSRIGPESTVRDVLPALLIAGLGLGLASSPTTTAAMSSVPTRSTGIGGATVTVSRLLGLALGVAVMGTIVSVGWPGGTVITGGQRAVFAGALGVGFAVNAALALLGGVAAVVFIRPTRPASSPDAKSSEVDSCLGDSAAMPGDGPDVP
ncbi:MAG: MFS transporter [Frankiales bacterium]|nr:MFS transporter [Frankiales bacterium]